MWYLEVQKFYQVNAIESVFISGMIFVGIGIGTPLLGWITNKMHSRIKVIHVTLCLGVMALLLGLYLPKFAIPTLLITQIVSFLIGFFLSGSMLFYTLVSEIADNNTRGVAISVLNTAVFLFNTALLFLPFVFITAFSKEFFTYLWVLPFFIIFAILLLPFIQDSFHPTEGESKCLKQ
jgi:MFS family permease